jgi:hypothetical protein
MLSLASRSANVHSLLLQAMGLPEPEIVHFNPKEFDFGKDKPFPMRDQHFFTSIDKVPADAATLLANMPCLTAETRLAEARAQAQAQAHGRCG